jgi:hypothetical protein
MLLDGKIFYSQVLLRSASNMSHENIEITGMGQEYGRKVGKRQRYKRDKGRVEGGGGVRDKDIKEIIPH